MPDPERVEPGTNGRVARLARNVRARAEWLVYCGAGLACAALLDARTRFIPRLGEWYSADSRPTVILQLRAWLSGRLAPIPLPVARAYDYVWGRGGLHVTWGLGLPIVGIPFHLVARLFGAPGFPDHVRFLILYAATVALFARALHRTSRDEPSALAASIATAGLFLAFPTFVGLLAARFLIYDQVIAVGALWTVLLLAGVLWLLERSTTLRLVIVCAGAAFVTFIRPPLAAYAVTTVVLGALVAHRRGVGPRGILAGLTAGAVVTALYVVANVIRFGSPVDAGYANIDSGPLVNRLTRWGVEFAHVPFTTAAKELFVTLFRFGPIPSQVISASPATVPPAIAPYAVGERWREYYSPTYDLWVFAGWIAAFGLVAWRIARGRLWRRDRSLAGEVSTIVGLWALPPSVVLFVFYARVGNLATRYLVDMYPAYAGALLCVAMAVVDGVRARAPHRVVTAQLAIAAVTVLYFSTWGGWPRHINHAMDRKALDARIATLDARMVDQPIPPSHVAYSDPRGPEPAYDHLAEWRRDGSFQSGMVFAMPRSPCVTFTFEPRDHAEWSPADEESLDGFRANADFDALVRCGAATGADGSGASRNVTMCEPHPPRFLLDGMRLYAIATLDSNLRPIDRLKLLRIDAAPACP